MDGPWQYQLRVYLSEPEAQSARSGQPPAPLAEILSKHDATMVSQLDAFEAYIAEAEREGIENYPLCRWTKATVADPEMRAKHGVSFAIRAHGEEVYAKSVADPLEADLRPLVDNGIVDRMSKHDTNSAKNIPIPEEYRSPS